MNRPLQLSKDATPFVAATIAMPSVVMSGAVPVAIGRTLGKASKASTHGDISWGPCRQ